MLHILDTAKPIQIINYHRNTYQLQHMNQKMWRAKIRVIIMCMVKQRHSIEITLSYTLTLKFFGLYAGKKYEFILPGPSHL